MSRALRWKKWNRWNALPVLSIPKNCCLPFTVPLFHLLALPIPKNYQKEFSLNLPPLSQLFHSLRWNRWNTLPVYLFTKKMSHFIYYSSIPSLPIPKNHQKECSLNYNRILCITYQIFSTGER